MNLRIFLFLTFLLTGAAAAQEGGYKPEAWLADFTQLKREMAAHYANLEWAIEERGMDLKALSEQIESRLRESKNESEARDAIEFFLRQFADAHLRVDWQLSGRDAAPTDADKPETEVKLCRELGYAKSPWQKPGVAFSGLKNFKPFEAPESDYFPGGVLTTGNGKRIGVLRIALFTESNFPDLCEKAAAELNLAGDSNCGDECRNKINRRASELLTRALTGQIKNLTGENIYALVVDITGNGGGSNWYEPAAQAFTPKRLESFNFGFIRHEHWKKQFTEQLKTVEAELEKTSSSKHRRLLNQASGVLRGRLAEAGKSCDRLAVWKNLKPDCSLVVVTPAKILPRRDAGIFPTGDVKKILFGSAGDEYRKGAFKGKLLILMDPRTASSAEAFAATLSDNRAATLIGQPSMGAGCGYTNGGIPTVLANSRASVLMPDCVRMRADGSNEVAGITPDVLIAWRANDTSYQKAKRVAKTLEFLF
jgi:hypothetical protein